MLIGFFDCFCTFLRHGPLRWVFLICYNVSLVFFVKTICTNSNDLIMTLHHAHHVYECSNHFVLKNPYCRLHMRIFVHVYEPCVFYNKNHFSIVFHKLGKCIVSHQNELKYVVWDHMLIKTSFYIEYIQKYDVDLDLHDVFWYVLLNIIEREWWEWLIHKSFLEKCITIFKYLT